jgi:hypothetical protein
VKTLKATVRAPDSIPAPPADPYALILVRGAFALVLEAAREAS